MALKRAATGWFPLVRQRMLDLQTGKARPADLLVSPEWDVAVAEARRQIKGTLEMSFGAYRREERIAAARQAQQALDEAVALLPTSPQR